MPALSQLTTGTAGSLILGLLSGEASYNAAGLGHGSLMPSCIIGKNTKNLWASGYMRLLFCSRYHG
jgi:hypothetical protein